MQTNFVTSIPYTRENENTLNHARIAGGFKENAWMTYLQAKSIGRTIKRGEKGVKLCKVLEEIDKETKQKKRSIKRFVVFNLEQTEISCDHGHGTQVWDGICADCGIQVEALPTNSTL